MEEDDVPLSAKSVQGEVEDQDCGRLSNGAEEKVKKYISRKLGGIQRKTGIKIDVMTTVYIIIHKVVIHVLPVIAQVGANPPYDEDASGEDVTLLEHV